MGRLRKGTRRSINRAGATANRPLRQEHPSSAQDTPAIRVKNGGGTFASADTAVQRQNTPTEPAPAGGGCFQWTLSSPVGAGGYQGHIQALAKPDGFRMGRHPDRKFFMPAGKPARAMARTGQEQRDGTRPPFRQAAKGFRRDGRKIRRKLACIRTDQDQPLGAGPPLDTEKAPHGASIAGIATESETGFGGIGDDTASPEESTQTA